MAFLSPRLTAPLLARLLSLSPVTALLSAGLWSGAGGSAGEHVL